MNRLTFIRRRAKLLNRAHSQAARKMALHPLTPAEQLVCQDYALIQHGKGSITPSIIRVLNDLEQHYVPDSH